MFEICEKNNVFYSFRIDLVATIFTYTDNQQNVRKKSIEHDYVLYSAKVRKWSANTMEGFKTLSYCYWSYMTICIMSIQQHIQTAYIMLFQCAVEQKTCTNGWDAIFFSKHTQYMWSSYFDDFHLELIFSEHFSLRDRESMSMASSSQDWICFILF